MVKCLLHIMWGEDRGKQRLHDINYCLDNSINFPGRVVTIRTPADQHGSVPAHQSKRKPLEEVPGSLALLLAGVPGKGSSQHLES